MHKLVLAQSAHAGVLRTLVAVLADRHQILFEIEIITRARDAAVRRLRRRQHVPAVVVDEQMILRRQLQLGRLDRQLDRVVDVVRMDYHGWTMRRDRRLHTRGLLLAALLHRRFLHALRRFLWLGWIEKLMGGLESKEKSKKLRWKFLS